MKWFKYLSIGAFIAGWLQKATKDGIITQEEIETLINQLLKELDFKNIKIYK